MALYERLSDGKPGLLGAMIARAEAQVMRVACIYALLDQSAVVQAEHLLAAFAFWDYAETSARYIFGDALGDPVADPVLRALRQSPDGLTRTQIRDVLGRHENGAAIDRALALLGVQGLATLSTEETGGRPRERWTATKASEATKHGRGTELSSLPSLSSPAASYVEAGQAILAELPPTVGQPPGPDTPGRVFDPCQECGTDVTAYLPNGTPVCDRHNQPPAGDVPGGGDAPAACPDCHTPLAEEGRCRACDYARCRECGTRTTSALATHCGRCHVKPTETKADSS